MWLRRLLRGRRPPPPPLLPSLEQLAELVERIVELLDETPVERRPEPEVAHNPGPAHERLAEGHLLFLSTADGYRLVEREGLSPERGQLLELAEGRFHVLRLGPSPLPGDRRRCACLEREEPPSEDRTFDR